MYLEFKTAKKNFFDAKKIEQGFDRETKRATVKGLAFIRRRSRSKLRRRNRPARKGQPPSVHSTSKIATLKAIFFAYDQRTKSGVVGPLKLNSRQSVITSSQELPGLLEAGGTMRIPEESYDGQTWYVQKKSRRHSRRKPPKKRVRIAQMGEHPFMGPSLQEEVEAGNVISPWSNVVTG